MCYRNILVTMLYYIIFKVVICFRNCIQWNEVVCDIPSQDECVVGTYTFAVFFVSFFIHKNYLLKFE